VFTEDIRPILEEMHDGQVSITEINV